MRSIFQSRSRLKPQKDFQNKSSDNKRGPTRGGPHKTDQKDTNGESWSPYGGRDDGACGGKRCAWTAPPLMRIVSPHKASVNERSSSSLQQQNYGHRSGPDNAAESGEGHSDHLEFETEALYQNRDKRPPERGTSFSSWFGPTLNYVFKAEKEDRNEIRVLALGILQFIDEVFDALDANKRGYVHHQDFMTLCGLLGKNLPARDTCEVCTSKICANENCAIHIHYYEFKRTLQRLFESEEGHQNISDYRNNEKLIETVAKVSRRTETLKYIAKLLEEVEDKFKSIYKTGLNNPPKGHSLVGFDKNRNQKRDSKLISKNLDLQRQVLLQLQELQCLREIVEDFRVALQTSDAENLALRVAAKRDETKCASERNNLHHLSFPNEDDSIDRLIINFPSSETLGVSDPNFAKLHPAEGPTFSSQNLMESRFRNLLDKSYEDLDIQFELEEVYRELFDAKEKIAELKLNLDRNKTRELNEATFQLNRMTEEAAEAAEATKELEGENQRCRKQLEEINSINDTLLKELKEWKEKCERTTNELEEMKRSLKQVKKLRRQELKQFVDLRSLLMDALAATRDSQAQSPTQSPTRSHLRTGIKDDGVSRESLLPDGVPTFSRVMTSESPGKRKLDHEFGNKECLETYDNVDNNELYRIKLRRQALLEEEAESWNSVYGSDEERKVYGTFPVSSIENGRDEKGGQRKKVRKDVTRSMEPRKNLIKIPTDTKPVLEVKPNIIKPWIAFDQPSPKAVNAEKDFGMEKAAAFGLSSPDDLEFAKVSSELCKEITETFSILNESMDSYGSAESYGSRESYGSTKSHVSLDGCDSSISVLSDSGSYKVRNENGEDGTLSPGPTEYSYDEMYQNSESSETFEYSIPGFEEYSTPFKSSPRSSTQILESLEFEVDLLRKSLEEENLWR